MCSSFPFEAKLSIPKQMKLWFVTNPGRVGRVSVLAFNLGSQNWDLRLQKTNPLESDKEEPETEVHVFYGAPLSNLLLHAWWRAPPAFDKQI